MRVVAAVLLVLAFAGLGAAQSPASMVVVIKGEKQFHQPSCPLVAKAGSNVTVAKLGEAKLRGLTAHDCPVAAATPTAEEVNQTKVVSQPGDNKYHRATCSKLGKQQTTMTLDEAGRKLWPCPVCKPPIRQRKTG
jgi:hypothetical protein